MSHIRLIFAGLLLVLISPGFSNASITPIDLNDFFFLPMDPVLIEGGGSMATIGENPPFPILLSNDPAFDPEVVFAEIAGIPQRLSFEYIFSSPPGNTDEFGAFLIDGSTGNPIGAPLLIRSSDLIGSSTMGTHHFDLSSFSGKQLGLQFQLTPIPGDPLGTSTLKISNVRLQSIPEPSSIAAWGILLAIAGATRRKSGQARLANR